MTRLVAKATDKEGEETEDVPLQKPGRKPRATGKADERVKVEPLQNKATKRKGE